MVGNKPGEILKDTQETSSTKKEATLCAKTDTHPNVNPNEFCGESTGVNKNTTYKTERYSRTSQLEEASSTNAAKLEGVKLGWCHHQDHGWFKYDVHRPLLATHCPKCPTPRGQEDETVKKERSDLRRKMRKEYERSIRPDWWEKSTGNYTWSNQPWGPE